MTLRTSFDAELDACNAEKKITSSQRRLCCNRTLSVADRLRVVVKRNHDQHSSFSSAAILQ